MEVFTYQIKFFMYGFLYTYQITLQPSETENKFTKLIYSASFMVAEIFMSTYNSINAVEACSSY